MEGASNDYEKLAHLGDARRKFIISRKKLSILLCVSKNEAVSVSELTYKTGIAGANLTKILDELEQSNMVRRDRDQKDRRKCIIKLLPGGEEIAISANRIMNSLPQSLISPLSFEDRVALIYFLKNFPEEK